MFRCNDTLVCLLLVLSAGFVNCWRYYDMFLTSMKCNYDREYFDGTCSISEFSNPYPLNFRLINKDVPVNELRIHVQSLVRMDNGTDVKMADTNIDFCSYTHSTSHYPMFHIIYQMLSVAGDLPKACPFAMESPINITKYKFDQNQMAPYMPEGEFEFDIQMFTNGNDAFVVRIQMFGNIIENPDRKKIYSTYHLS